VDYAERRLLRLGRHFDRVHEVVVEFEDASRRVPHPSCVVRISVRSDGPRLPLTQATESAPDARAALDLALDKVDRQVVKLKEKVKIERKRASQTAGDDVEVDDEQDARRGELERVRLKLQPQSVEDAETALESSPNPCYVFLDEGTGTVNVCFRRPDGGLTVIESVVT
jgi:putative sigma-54 modulation protein